MKIKGLTITAETPQEAKGLEALKNYTPGPSHVQYVMKDGKVFTVPVTFNSEQPATIKTKIKFKKGAPAYSAKPTGDPKKVLTNDQRPKDSGKTNRAGRW